MRRMEQRREALTEHEAREVILRGIDAQCNKRSPLVIFKSDICDFVVLCNVIECAREV